MKKKADRIRMDEPVEVAIYDRAMLEPHTVQPIAIEDGHTITVDKLGRFGAILGDVTIVAPTLERARERVHDTHLAQERKRKKKALAVPAFILDRSTGGYRGSENVRDQFCGVGFFRGVHAGNGAIQYAKPDGSKAHSDSTWIWPRDHPDVDHIKELHETMLAAYAVSSAADDELRELCKAQKERMYGERPGFGGYGGRPRIVNNAMKAADQADAIVSNVLKPNVR